MQILPEIFKVLETELFGDNCGEITINNILHGMGDVGGVEIRLNCDKECIPLEELKKLKFDGLDMKIITTDYHTIIIIERIIN